MLRFDAPENSGESPLNERDFQNTYGGGGSSGSVPPVLPLHNQASSANNILSKPSSLPATGTPANPSGASVLSAQSNSLQLYSGWNTPILSPGEFVYWCVGDSDMDTYATEIKAKYRTDVSFVEDLLENFNLVYGGLRSWLLMSHCIGATITKVCST